MNYGARAHSHSHKHTSRERKERLKVNTWNRACIDGASTRKHCANTFLFRRKKKLNHWKESAFENRVHTRLISQGKQCHIKRLEIMPCTHAQTFKTDDQFSTKRLFFVALFSFPPYTSVFELRFFYRFKTSRGKSLNATHVNRKKCIKLKSQ